VVKPRHYVDLPVGADGRIEGIPCEISDNDVQVPVGGQEGGRHPGVGIDSVSSDFAFRLMSAFGDGAIVTHAQPEAALAGIVMVGIVVIGWAGAAGEGIAVVQTARYGSSRKKLGKAPPAAPGIVTWPK